MRLKETLFSLSEFTVLCQYLYMDEKHTVTFSNGVTDLSLRMNDDLSVICKNLRFPDVPEVIWNDEFYPANCLNIIALLKEMPPEEFKDGSFSSRWDEIKTITLANLGYNKKSRY